MIKKLYKCASILIVFIFFFISIISCKTVITQKETSAQTIEESGKESSIKEETNNIKIDEESTAVTENQSIEVDKGIFNVEITLPASFFEGEDIDKIVDEVNGEGINIIKNDDGSVTYKMSKLKHNEIMKEMNNSLIEYIDEIKNSEDYKSIKDITYNKTFSELTLVVEQEKFENSFDGVVALGLGIMSMYYQLFNGINPEDYRVLINYKNVETGEIFGNVVYPDAFED